MAALTNAVVATRLIPSLKGYRIHEEQVRNIAQCFRELYHIRRTGRQAPARNKKEPKDTAGSESGAFWAPHDGHVWVTGTVRGPILYSPEENPSSWKSPGSMKRAVRCVQCGIDFPVADFLYTKKSGLCIDCWEKQVI